MQCLSRRFVEVILTEIILSLSIVIFYFLGLVKSNLLALFFSSAFAIIYLVWTEICLFGYRISVDGKKTYYKTNFFVYSVLSAIVLALTSAIHFLGNSRLSYYLRVVNSLLFLPFKVFYYLGLWVGIPIGLAPSAAIFSAIIFIVVATLPLFVNKRRFLRRHWEFDHPFFE